MPAAYTLRLGAICRPTYRLRRTEVRGRARELANRFIYGRQYCACKLNLYKSRQNFKNSLRDGYLDLAKAVKTDLLSTFQSF